MDRNSSDLLGLKYNPNQTDKIKSSLNFNYQVTIRCNARKERVIEISMQLKLQNETIS